MGGVYPGIHRPLAVRLMREFGLQAFIETGLYQGDSLMWAWESGFQQLVSIEISKGNIKEFKKQHPNLVVNLMHGSSADLLEDAILSVGARPILFWLDAHSVPETPVLKELSAINKHSPDCVIMIDDVRLFGVQGNWPPLKFVIAALINGGQRTAVLVDDVLIGCSSQKSKDLLDCVSDMSNYRVVTLSDD